jgi:hypothetical protein
VRPLRKAVEPVGVGDDLVVESEVGIGLSRPLLVFI